MIRTRLPDFRTTQTVTIAAGQSISEAIDLGSRVAWAVQMPAEWTEARLSFQCSLDGETWADMKDFIRVSNQVQVQEYSLPAGASDFVWLSIDLPRFLKIRSGTASVPVAQAAERVLTLGIYG